MIAGAEDIIYTPGPPRWQRDELIDVLRKTLRSRADAAYLFGSYARGEATADSDIDLIIVTDTVLRWPTRADLFSDLLDALGPVDFLVYTPQEWATMTQTNHPFTQLTENERISLL